MPLRTRSTWWGVVLDAPDGPALAEFYARLLGWRLFPDPPNGAAVAPSEDGGYNIACQTEPLYVRPVWPAVEGQPQMMLHLDLQVDELVDSVAFALGCGAELASYQPQENVRVLLDPAGHPFCLYVDEGE
jgi:hypothetical protein